MPLICNLWAQRQDPLHSAVHVIPLDDMYSHKRFGDDCWCAPDTEPVPDGTMVIHNAADEREKFRAGLRQPS